MITLTEYLDQVVDESGMTRGRALSIQANVPPDMEYCHDCEIPIDDPEMYYECMNFDHEISKVKHLLTGLPL